MTEQVKPWRVLHACESGRDAVELAEAESAVGMSPQLLSREYWNPGGASKEVSLLNVWHDVRDWRHALNEAEALTSVQIVHAHSFASAMAGVRGNLPLVYDFADTLEDMATHQAHATSGPWLLRSLRVAEQFALSRAGAVVAHTQAMKRIANERGAASENVFLVSEPWSTASAIADVEWMAKRDIHPERDVVILVLMGSHDVEVTSKALAAVVADLPEAVFVAECEDESAVRIAGELSLGKALRWVQSEELAQAMAWADVVVVAGTGEAQRSNPRMLQAMAAGKAVVAADTADNRECSRDGQGCIWFNPGSEIDLAQRIVFVGRNRQFARSLGDSGREHMARTRGPMVVGRQYDEVYRHVQARRNESMNLKIEMPKIYALGMQT